MPKVPAIDWDQGSIASGASNAFSGANDLWTPDMDHRLPSLEEQRIMAVAKATRAKLAFEGQR